MTAKHETVDAYIADFPAEVQDTLRRIEATISAVAPTAQRCISYGIPAFKLEGKMLVYFSGWAKHVSLYPVPPGSAAFTKKIEPFIAGKGTLQFSLAKPIPYGLITQIAKAHVARLKSDAVAATAKAPTSKTNKAKRA